MNRWNKIRPSFSSRCIRLYVPPILKRRHNKKLKINSINITHPHRKSIFKISLNFHSFSYMFYGDIFPAIHGTDKTIIEMAWGGRNNLPVTIFIIRLSYRFSNVFLSYFLMQRTNSIAILFFHNDSFEIRTTLCFTVWIKLSRFSLTPLYYKLEEV